MVPTYRLRHLGTSQQINRGRVRVSLARFFSRINDAISPLLTGGTDLQTFLRGKIVCLKAPDSLEEHPIHLAGFVLATNLCARLYPRLRILAPSRVVEQCASIALQINPLCQIETKRGTSDAELAWAVPPESDFAVVVAPAGWEVFIDLPDSRRIQRSNMLVSLAAATIGVGELFRSVSAQFLATGRVGISPGRLNILTLDELPADLPQLASKIDIGRVYLVGAGAIGQAAIYTLARVSATGSLVVVDPEQIALSNLQRYVLAIDSDVGVSKCSLVTRALQGSGIETVCCESRWGDDELSMDNVEVVCTAVDTEAVRIGIQASLPRRIYNAWTQPADLGWSRHESFGDDPCLACLYWPNRKRPSHHELIARAIRQHELRVLAYLTFRLPVDVPLRPEQIPRLPNLPVPADSTSWIEHSLLDDIVHSLEIALDDAALWKGKHLSDLYREGICGGALISRHIGEIAQEIAVPLAHQSVLAGIMLAAQVLIANSPELLPFRPVATEARLNVLAGLPQIAPRPRQRSQGCICSDLDFVDRYRTKWTGF